MTARPSIAPVPGRKGLFDANRLFVAACVGIPALGLLLFFVQPVAIVFLRSITEPDGSYGLGNYHRILEGARFWRVTGQSLVMTLITTAISVGAGFVIALALYRGHFRGKWFVRGAILLPLLAPSLMQSLGLIFLLGRNGIVSRILGTEIEIYGLWGLVIANTLYALPQAVMIIGAALVLLDARVYEAADVMGARPFRQFRDLTLPAAKYGILSAIFVVFTITITDFGNAAVIGGNYTVLATEIYRQVVGRQNFNLGAVVGIMLLLPTVLAYFIERQASRKSRGQKAAGILPYVPKYSPLRDIPLAAFSFVVSGFVVLVMAVVVYASFVTLWPYDLSLSLKNYAIDIAGGYDSLWITIWISLWAAAVGTVFVFALGVGLRHAPAWIAQPLQVLAAMPAAVPGLVLGLAYIMAFNSLSNPFNFLYGTATLIIAVNFYHYHTQAFLTLQTGFRQFPETLEEAGASLGANLGRLSRDVVLPFMAPMLVSVLLFLFMRSMVTISAVVFLSTPSVSVASFQILRLEDSGRTSQAAAFSTALMGVVILALLLLTLLNRVIASHHRAG